MPVDIKANHIDPFKVGLEIDDMISEGGPVQHLHTLSHRCTCSISGLEPNENCPVHGYGEWPPRCEICGQFLKWSNQDLMAEGKLYD